jgi:DNA repair protein RadC
MKITSSRDAADYIRNFYQDDIYIYESVFILLLNRANQTIGYAKISQGGISGTVVDIRIILKYAIESLASGVIMAHNHPSGQLNPSPQDIQLTKKLREAMLWMDISLLDSLIVMPDNYYSMADEGII